MAVTRTTRFHRRDQIRDLTMLRVCFSLVLPMRSLNVYALIMFRPSIVIAMFVAPAFQDFFNYVPLVLNCGSCYLNARCLTHSFDLIGKDAKNFRSQLPPNW